MIDLQQLVNVFQRHKIMADKTQRWTIGGAIIEPQAIAQIPDVMAIPGYNESELIQLLNYIPHFSKTLFKIPPAEFGQITVGVFLEELAKDPSQRRFLDKSLPRYVVDKSFRHLPYDMKLPSNIMNESDLMIQYKQMVELNKSRYGSVKSVDVMLNNYILSQRSIQEKAISDMIKYKPEKVAEADMFLGELYNLYMPAFVSFEDEFRYDFEFFKGVIRHVIWNVKTKAIAGQNVYPVMLNLSGDQGNGKTSFTTHLFGDLLGSLYSVQNINVLNDEFGMSLLKDQWAIFFDEMVNKNGDIDIDRLKQIITNTTVRTRVMFSQKFETTIIRSVFIGSANRPIYEIIHDESGMRRYLNLEFRRTSIKKYKALHTKLDQMWADHGLAIWQSVDETKTAGYLVGDLENMWDDARNSYMSENSTVYLWLKATKANIVTRATKNTAALTMEDAFEEYNKHWHEKKRTTNLCQIKTFRKFIKDYYNSRHGTSYDSGELRVWPMGLVYNETHEFSEDYDFDADANMSVVMTKLDKYAEFKPVDLGPGVHLTDFLIEDVGVSGGQSANASANVENAVSGQISPIPGQNIGGIGNIGSNLGSKINSAEGGESVVAGGQSGQYCQFEDREPTADEIQWYLDNYGFLDELEKDQPDEDPDTEDAMKALEYLRDWQIQLNKKRAQRRAQKLLEEYEEEEFFRRLGETPNLPKVEIHDGEDVHSSGSISHEEPAEYEADAKHDALVAAELAETETKSDVEEDDFFQEIRRREGMQ